MVMWYWHGQQIIIFESCQLTITWMSIIKLNTCCRLSNKLKNIISQMGRPMGVQSHDYQNFSDAWINKFSYHWCSAAHASRVQELCFKCCLFLAFPRRHKEQSGSPFLLNPLSPNIHIQILQTDLHTSLF